MLWAILVLCAVSAAASLGCVWLLLGREEEKEEAAPEAESAEERELRESILNLMRYEAFGEKEE